MSDALAAFVQIWLVDFEFHQPPGERSQPICMVARELRTGRTLRLWEDELAAMTAPPIPVGQDVLFVAHYASAEIGCYLALGWPPPTRVLDLFAEFRNITNGLETVCGNGLLGALAQFGLGAIEAAEKDEMRDLAIRGGPYTETERRGLLEYCESDVVSLANLLPAMLPRIDVPRALLRGRYMAAAAMEFHGVPIDVDTLHSLQSNWDHLKGNLIREIDQRYCVFPEKNGAPHFSAAAFAAYLTHRRIPWPQLPSGRLALDDNTFRQMAKVHPELIPLQELRNTLGSMRLFTDLAVGGEGRNRCLLSVFRSITGRNQPSNAKFIFGPATWVRSLIRPEPGTALAYVDWSQQEFGIAAALSGDQAMMRAYASGDPYLTFAKQAGAVPADATKESHPLERERFKVCALAVQYGMGEKSLAVAIEQPPAMARELLRLHRHTYPRFWSWSQAAVDHAMLRGWLETVFGWRVHVGPKANPRSLANFPMQANGAEMLRLACCLLTERGIRVCAPVHDAVLIESSVDQIEGVVADTQAAMAEASRTVLCGFELRSDADIVRYPDRYSDPRGKEMWAAVMGLLVRREGQSPEAPDREIAVGPTRTCVPDLRIGA